MTGSLKPLAHESRKLSNAAAKTADKFFKTKMCPWFSQGRCRLGDACNWAHHPSEVRVSVDLSRTKLCHHLTTGGKCMNPSCRFAHRREELRATTDVYKTSLCVFWMRGGCFIGQKCRYAHGLSELRYRSTRRAQRPPPNLLLLDPRHPNSLQGSVSPDQEVESPVSQWAQPNEGAIAQALSMPRSGRGPRRGRGSRKNTESMPISEQWPQQTTNRALAPVSLPSEAKLNCGGTITDTTASTNRSSAGSSSKSNTDDIPGRLLPKPHQENAFLNSVLGFKMTGSELTSEALGLEISQDELITAMEALQSLLSEPYPPPPSPAKLVSDQQALQDVLQSIVPGEPPPDKRGRSLSRLAHTSNNGTFDPFSWTCPSMSGSDRSILVEELRTTAVLSVVAASAALSKAEDLNDQISDMLKSLQRSDEMPWETVGLHDACDVTIFREESKSSHDRLGSWKSQEADRSKQRW
eukprot:Blabericola_migrator_1__1778@NODE_1480_length_4456_cov_88_006380_g971_i0_p1_GENE_NODE_1480_length_4456_cov_88_006380_g971_i0NODE_1480_length_4456_cov_88_006380_g971_i0_p1_ORF_typecomplete_len466_score58_17zfCCCH/PF00642_24/1_7e05zfCCCH/PF00642_24/5zfCCCH/PF00642_24/1_2e06zfCCCH_3/PF15663_5/7_1e07zfCCCH_3/PF15663_5/0_068Torus/PF16131_5/0_00083Torus/PF16131_5/1_3e03Torus/PF16131_5/2_5e05zfCCCH_4/PF18044_1/0_029zfCCCH_4/PF18044_1/78zfCCCH_4/PF18044_1/0_0012zf_CCCH_4/PF18345_1/1_5e03zf_CCCH_4/PF1834